MNKLPKEMIEDRSITGNQIAEKTITRENLADDAVAEAVDVDSVMSNTSTNPVQNKVVTAKITEVEESVANKLSLSGGTMTGNIKASNTRTFIIGSSWRSGPIIEFIGSESGSSRAGELALSSGKDGAGYTLSITAAGEFIAQGKNIVRSVDNVQADAAGNVALNALKTTGGTMTGIIYWPNNAEVGSAGNGTYVAGFPLTDGSRIVATRLDSSYGGNFYIQLPNGGPQFGLYNATREMMWAGKHVVRSVNGTNADAAGNVTLSAVLPTGSVIAFAGNPSSAPSGYLLCNGAAVSRTTYAALYAEVGTTYGSGDGSTTFNLPNLIDKFIQGSATAGTIKAAGLPNITGTVQSYIIDNYGSALRAINGSGAFSNSLDSTKTSYGFGLYEHYYNRINVDLNASKSSSIYGSSTTVQPPALTMRFYIKY